MRIAPRLFILLASMVAITPSIAAEWQSIEAAELQNFDDDDIERHRAVSGYFAGISIGQTRFSENGFDWHLLRFTHDEKADGPLWVVPHDDENAAFDAMMEGLRQYGGTAIVVNTGAASSRRQTGNGLCGIQTFVTSACDPNRNFDYHSPVFTQAILSGWKPGRPVIALHTNGDGFAGDGAGGRGDITMLDAQAFRRGRVQPRKDGHFGIKREPLLDDPDVFAILPYSSKLGISKSEEACRLGLNGRGIHVWHERVGRSDGSLSNYIVLNRPEIAYVNFEAERDEDLANGAAAHRLMSDAYLADCADLWHEPAALPATAR